MSSWKSCLTFAELKSTTGILKGFSLSQHTECYAFSLGYISWVIFLDLQEQVPSKHQGFNQVFPGNTVTFSNYSGKSLI